jgi:DNA polymerase sigma
LENSHKKGGIGSYALILLILSFLQHHSLNRNLKYWEEDLGILLTDFFDFYGNDKEKFFVDLFLGTKFNYCRTGISVRNGGSYFSKVNLNILTFFLFFSRKMKEILILMRKSHLCLRWKIHMTLKTM